MGRRHPSSHLPFNANTIDGDGRLMRYCKCKVGHPVGHLDPGLMKWPSLVMHQCCPNGCCYSWDIMTPDYIHPEYRRAS